MWDREASQRPDKEGYCGNGTGVGYEEKKVQKRMEKIGMNV